MNRKLQLDQNKHYEQAVAAEYLAQMIVGYVEGRQHFISIGAEQGDIVGWDDFVIEEEENKQYVHLQIKRQQTDFSNEKLECIRNKNSKGNFYDLSPLDKAFQSLSKWIKSGGLSNTRKFILILPSENLLIKKDLEIRNLSDFQIQNIKVSTTATKLSDLQKSNSVANNIFNWLNTWCDFDSWKQILDAFQRLEIKRVELETDINTRTSNSLHRVFQNPDEVLTLIKSFIHQNSSYTSELKPKHLVLELKDHLKKDIPFWTQFQKVDSKWRISGIHDLENKINVERPSVMVPKLWNNNYASRLKLSFSEIDSNLPSPLLCIFQLAVHLNGTSSGDIFNLEGWKQVIKSKSGHTLGISESDFENLSLREISEHSNPTEYTSLQNPSSMDVFSDSLDKEIIADIWKKVSLRVLKKIEDMDTSGSTELRDAVNERWEKWKGLLDQDVSRQKNMFVTMVFPKAESKNVRPEFRIGPKTVDHLAKGMFYQLVVSTALTKVQDEIDYIDENSLSTIAIGYWSGPDGNSARSINDEGIEILLGKEIGVLILANTQSSPTEIYNESLAAVKKDSTSLAAGNFPSLLVTEDMRFKKLIRQGKVNDLSTYLTERMINNDGIESAINRTMS